ncbi:unnamed protein product [Clonostachys solani]|uniref:Uncharacterized protein n=1 Tax=Clonostachys solani TaxID=160281 RepID=A0A9N9ZD99_9HYPO|nr:unnamed protein product [Clonostachys solani]
MPEDDNNPEVDIPLLAQHADPAPIMLSNMRLNVLRRWGDEDGKQLRGKVVFELVRTIKDASFRVPRAEVA